MTFPDDYENKVICGDCLEVMKDIPDNSVDLVLTDPPYGITACEWDTVPDLAKLWEILKRIGKPNCVYVFTASQPFTTDLINSNRKWFKYEWIWDKVNLYTGALNANIMPLKRHENIVVFSDNLTIYNKQYRRGEPYYRQRKNQIPSGEVASTKTQSIPTINNGQHNPCSILQVKSNIKTEKGLHPTQKPLELMKYLVLTYSNPGGLILDCFCGSGTTLVAAKDLDRRFIGVELNQGYVDICHKRLNAVHPKLEGIT